MPVSLNASEELRDQLLSVDEHYDYVQVFSGDTLAPDRRRRGLAIEPLTCPPNAFRTHTDLIVLEPGATLELNWGIKFDNGLTRS